MGYQKLTPIIATGATAPRYLGDRFADIVNVMDFGAVADGVTDDAASFSAAAAVSDYVFVPAGTYCLSEDVSGGFFALDDVSITGTGGAVNGETRLYSLARLVTPIGSVFLFTGSTVPSGSLLCNGAAVSRTTYADLFAVIGTTYGTGDGSTTFNLPNLIDKFAQGSATPGTVHNAGLPNISGNTPAKIRTDLGAAAADSTWNGPFLQKFTDGARFVNNSSGWGGTAGYLYFNASKANSIYGNSSTVQPPALTLLPCIKY